MTTFAEIRHYQERNHIVCPVRLFKRLRMWLYWQWNKTVPLWLAIMFIVFCLCAAKPLMMM